MLGPAGEEQIAGIEVVPIRRQRGRHLVAAKCVLRLLDQRHLFLIRHLIAVEGFVQHRGMEPEPRQEHDDRRRERRARRQERAQAWTIHAPHHNRRHREVDRHHHPRRDVAVETAAEQEAAEGQRSHPPRFRIVDQKPQPAEHEWQRAHVVERLPAQDQLRRHQRKHHGRNERRRPAFPEPPRHRIHEQRRDDAADDRRRQTDRELAERRHGQHHATR